MRSSFVLLLFLVGSPALALPVPAQRLAVGDEPAGVVVADLDGDGIADLLSADAGADAVSVLLGDGAGGFAAAVSYPACAQPSSLAVGDVDGDGVRDVVVACFADHGLVLLPGENGGVLGPPTPVGTVKGPHWVACADLDGDRRAEIVSADGLPPDRELHVFRRSGAGSFERVFAGVVGLQSRVGRIADLDGDGHLDLAVVARAEDRVDVALGDGTGTFDGFVAYPVGRQPSDLQVRDLDEDGLPDLVTADLLDDGVSVLLGVGAGTFAGAMSFAAGPHPTAVAAGDLNGDCIADLAVAGAVGGAVSVLAGDGTGNLVPAGTVPLVGQGNALALADLDGDVRADLVVAVGGGADLLEVLAGSGPVCTTFSIRRGGDPATVRAGAPATVVQAGPFDDVPPAPLPGEALFWVIEHAGGLEAALSVHAGNAFTRIGFDDGDPASAAVDPFTSTVEVSGTVVRVIPKDAAGTALGRGLDFGVAILAGDPGLTLSPVRDTGNGSYELRVEGSGPGALTLVLTVEGVELDSLATVELP